MRASAGCQSGYVAACKAAYAGSIPAPASRNVVGIIRSSLVLDEAPSLEQPECIKHT